MKKIREFFIDDLELFFLTWKLKTQKSNIGKAWIIIKWIITERYGLILALVIGLILTLLGD